MIINCPFCREEIIEHTFAESNNCRAIYNISPIVKGHILIIPKAHFNSIFDLPEDVYADFMQFSRQISGFLKRHYNANGINWSLQDGIAAGQTVFHLHLHIIPRHKNDFKKSGDWYKKLTQQEIMDSNQRPKLSEKELANNVYLLKKSWNSH